MQVIAGRTAYTMPESLKSQQFEVVDNKEVFPFRPTDCTDIKSMGITIGLGIVQ